MTTEELTVAAGGCRSGVPDGKMFVVELPQELMTKTVRELELSSFYVPTGDVGCFWRAAGILHPRFAFVVDYPALVRVICRMMYRVICPSLMYRVIFSSLMYRVIYPSRPLCTSSLPYRLSPTSNC